MFTVYNLITFILGAFATLGLAYAIIRNFYKKEKRLFDNLNSRKIIIFGPHKSSKESLATPEDMRMELDLLRKTGFLMNLPSEIYQNISDEKINLIDSNSLVIIGYNSHISDDVLMKLFNQAVLKRAPVIIYAYEWLDRKGEVYKRIKEYPHHSMCETGLRLVNDIFATLATYPYEKTRN